MSLLQRATSQCYLGKQSQFIVRTAQNIKICSVGRMQKFSMAKQVGHVEPSGFKEAESAYNILIQLHFLPTFC
jgi:hypothetical protein